MSDVQGTPTELLEILYHWYYADESDAPEHVVRHPLWPRNTPDRRLPMWAAVRAIIHPHNEVDPNDDD